MRKFLYAAALLLTTTMQVFAQNSIKVQAPEVVAVDEQFNVTFIIEGEKSASDFQWSAGDDFQLVWGPTKGTSSSISIVNGQRTSSRQSTYTYILMPKATGTFSLPSASASVGGEKIHSSSKSIQVVSDGASASQGQSSGSSSSNSSSNSSSSSSSSSTSSTGEISNGDIFLRLSVSRSQAVLGEPITASLKLYQRVNIAGFENAKFPTFNGFWSQETYAPTNIEFKRESLDDKIYNVALLRTYVLIPQQTGTITIDPAELVCLVNVRVNSGSSNSIFDSFFQDDVRTIRKRVTTSPCHVKVTGLPAGQPASFGGGVGEFTVSARLTSDELKTHDAASLIVTVKGKGNVALLEEPKVNFPPDFEVYDTKATENTDKSTGSTTGSKTFEYPFIPRSAGEFTIEPIPYSYYDVNSGKYVTLHTEPLTIKVAKGKGSESSSPVVVNTGVDKRDVKSLSDDIRFISTKKPSFSKTGSFFIGTPLFFVLLALLLGGALAIWLAFRKVAAMKADVAGSRNRKATKMARKRLKLAEDYLGKNLYTAFYEELHKTLIGFISDKLNMDMSELSKENIAASLVGGGVSEEKAKSFTDLLDACEFARYSPDAGHQAMQAHYDTAMEVITSIDSNLKNVKSKKPSEMAMIAVAVILSCGLSAMGQADACAQEMSDPATMWEAGVQAYNEGQYSDARTQWEAIASTGEVSPELYYNIGNAYFKENEHSKAILNYERALKLDPSYSDARYNLEFAGTFVQDKIEPVPEFILKSLARKVCYLMSSNAWTVVFLLLLGVALGMVLLFLLGRTSGQRRTGFYSSIAALILTLFALWFAIWQKTDANRADSAIVMAPVTAAKSSPSGNGTKDLFIIHEGTKVKILDEVSGWKNISLVDGRQGWIPSSDLEVI